MTAQTPRKLTQRQQLGARSRGEILDAALRLMSEQGYDGASIARIAAASGRPASSIYWHFGSKAGVLAAVMERGADEFFAALNENPYADGIAREPLEMLRAGFQQARSYVEARPDFLRLFFLLLLVEQPDDKVSEVVARVSANGRAVAHRIIRDAFAARGAVEATAIADRLALMALTYFNGVFLTTPSNPDATMEGLIDVLVDAVVALADVTDDTGA